MDKENISQVELAKMTGVSNNTISKIYNEKTEPKTRLALKIAKILKSSVEELFILTIVLLITFSAYFFFKRSNLEQQQRTNFSWVVNQKNCSSINFNNSNNEPDNSNNN